jgi:hypothetical protein
MHSKKQIACAAQLIGGRIGNYVFEVASEAVTLATPNAIAL